ncbi:MAG: Fic family protein [Kiritimatiellia bacterium]|jgi:Fic family protein
MQYNWQRPDWPKFNYGTSDFEAVLHRFSEKIGRVDGMLAALPEDDQTEQALKLLVEEAIKTSEIEGEMLSRPDVMSSIRKNLGLSGVPRQVSDGRALGISELLVCVRQTFKEKLSQKVLFDWHRMLMSGNRGVQMGDWRTHAESMQVISGTFGSEAVHFEAPPSSVVPSEMRCFIEWFNATAPGGRLALGPAAVRAAIVHLYFESIHPFEDGNGRIGRALAEKALAQGIGRPVAFSLSRSIEANRKAYYEALKTAQRSTDVTAWVAWFADIALTAQIQAEGEIEFTMKKVKLFDRIQDTLNLRQRKALERMLKEGPNGFEGGMTTKKYMAITGASKPTATRDLRDLVGQDVFLSIGGGRSTHYDVVM